MDSKNAFEECKTNIKIGMRRDWGHFVTCSKNMNKPHLKWLRSHGFGTEKESDGNFKVSWDVEFGGTFDEYVKEESRYDYSTSRKKS